MAGLQEKYDSTLLGILQHEGKIEKFLDVILGFLYRRTDFYRVMKTKEDKLGFPPGVALRILASVFKKYEELSVADQKKREKEKLEQEERQKKREEGTCESQAVAAPHVREDTKSTETKQEGSSAKSDQKSASSQQASQTDARPQKEEEKSDKTEAVSDAMEVDEAGGEGLQKTEDAKPSKSEAKDDEEKDDDPELTKQQKDFQSNPESYNGAVRENYRWAQSITDLDIRVNVPEYIRKGKDVKVDVDKKHIKVCYKDQSGVWQVPVNGDLTWEVHRDETVWSLVPGEHVHINLEKKEERWWEGILTDEPKISVRKIDASRPMTDLDDEAQAKIQEMMYNEQQKRMGKPQSHEQKVHGMLKKAWDAEGSPFKGQEFDPSKFSVDSSGVVNMKS